MRKKSRLTITLPKDLLKKIDKTIDGSIIRNRSHAIESLIRNSIKNPIESAVILAGNSSVGKNSALKEIDKNPLICNTLHQLSSAGISKAYICAGKDNHEIKNTIGNSELGVDLVYVSEPTPLGTGGIVKKAASKIEESNFIVIHGDVLADLNISALIRFHTQENTLATIAVKPRKNDGSTGKVLIEGNQITHFFESNQDQGIAIINAGIYIFKKEILSKFPGRVSSLEKDAFPMLAQDEQLTAFIFQGFWQDISDQKDYKVAKKTWANK